MRFLRQLAKRVLPTRFIDWYRRWRALRHYLQTLSLEIYGRRVRLDLEDLEGRLAMQRNGFYEQMVKDVLERTELVLQELDRRIEGLAARHGSELRQLRLDLEALKAAAAALAGVEDRDGNGAGPASDPARHAAADAGTGTASAAGVRDTAMPSPLPAPPTSPSRPRREPTQR